MVWVQKADTSLVSGSQNLSLSRFNNLLALNAGMQAKPSVTKILDDVIKAEKATIEKWKKAESKSKQQYKLLENKYGDKNNLDWYENKVPKKIRENYEQTYENPAADLFDQIVETIETAFDKAGYAIALPGEPNREQDRAGLDGRIHKNSAIFALGVFYDDLEAYAAGKIKSPEDIMNPNANPYIKARSVKVKAWDEARELIAAYDRNPSRKGLETIEKSLIATFENNGYIYTDYFKKNNKLENQFYDFPLNEAFPYVFDIVTTINVEDI